MASWSSNIANSGNWRRIVFEVLVLGAIVFALRSIVCIFTDDALITLRYARNLAEGLGLVYNPGERVYGTTSPGYALLLAVPFLLRIDPFACVFALDVFAATGIAWLLLAVGRELDRPAWGWIAALLVIHFPIVLMVPGMEATLFTLLIVGAVVSMAWDRGWPAASCAAAASLLRPEGAMLAAMVATWQLVDPVGRRLRPSGWKRALLTVGPLFVMVAVLGLYYGNPIPNTVAAKRVHLAVFKDHPTFIGELLHYQFRVLSEIRWWGVLEWAGLLILVVRWPRYWGFAAWQLAYLGFMWAGKAPSYVWYNTPLYPGRMLGLAVAGCQLAEWALLAPALLRRWRTPGGASPDSLSQSPRANQAVTAALATLLLLLTGMRSLWIELHTVLPFYFNRPDAFAHKNYHEAGTWLAAQPDSRSAETTVAEIGYIGYFGGTRIFDPLGLVSPEALPQLGKRDLWQWAIARESRFVVHPFWTDRSSTGKFEALPGNFVRAYRCAAQWNDGWFLTVAFEKRVPDSPRAVLPAANQRAGVHSRFESPGYCFPGTREADSRTFRWALELSGDAGDATPDAHARLPTIPLEFSESRAEIESLTVTWASATATAGDVGATGRGQRSIEIPRSEAGFVLPATLPAGVVWQLTARTNRPCQELYLQAPQ